MLDTADTSRSDETAVGSHFVANYPPFSVWSADAVDRDAMPALAAPARPEVRLGVYLHVPFCRRRCHFCYFRVYTGRNHEEVNRYLDWLVREWELYARQPAVADRALNFVYFGGGTPSFLSSRQLDSLGRRMRMKSRLSANQAR
jgi:oxygen-independent coproporphyrinogen-3 oxidase